MSIPKHLAKRDKNERRIVEYLRRCGASVAFLSSPGLPDLLVAYANSTLLMEIKGKNGKLTAAQQTFFDNWKGNCQIIRSIHDAKQALKGTLVMPKVIRLYVCPECSTTTEQKEDMKLTPTPPCCALCDKQMVQVYQSEVDIIYRGSDWTGAGKNKRV